MTASQSQTEYQVYSDFNDMPLSTREWDALAPTVFQTSGWLNAWWETFGRGQLLLIAAHREGGPQVIAPLFCDAGMIFFVGSGGSDYLDFLGDTDIDTLAGILATAREGAREFVGFRFYHVPDSGATGQLLERAAGRLGLRCFDEGELHAPRLDLRHDGAAAANKQSLVRHERWFRREGELRVLHTSPSREWLEEFFEQHIARWAVTPYPSLFLDPVNRAFYHRVATYGSDAGWLRFTRIEWESQPVAFHFGFHYRREFLWYKPSFDITLSKRSPGEVLLRSLLLIAMEEEAGFFDFGLGDEPFKQRFASEIRSVRTWGLYP